MLTDTPLLCCPTGRQTYLLLQEDKARLDVRELGRKSQRLH